MRVSIDNLQEIVTDIPEEPSNPSALEKRIWEKEVDDSVKRRSILKDNLKSLYSLIWGQCTPPMKAKIESLTGHKNAKAQSDLLGLLTSIRSVLYGSVSENKYKPQTIYEALRRFYHFKQDRFMTDSNYLEKFKTLVEVCDATECEIGDFRSTGSAYLVEKGIDIATSAAEQQQTNLDAMKEQYLAIAFLLSADRTRYGKMIDKLMNKFLQGDRDVSPINVTDAHRNMVHWRRDPRYQQRLEEMRELRVLHTHNMPTAQGHTTMVTVGITSIGRVCRLGISQTMTAVIAETTPEETTSTGAIAVAKLGTVHLNAPT